MAANDVEAPAPQTAAGDMAAASETSVGVLGWLGFIIINVAAWGIIAVSWEIVWVLGFIICACYTLGLIGLAVFFERRDPEKFHMFLNLLWVLAATFVFVTGLFVAFQIIGPLGTSPSPSPTPSPLIPDSLSSLLPDNASTELQAWADLSGWDQPQIDYSVFGDSLYFNGRDESTDRSVLLRSAAGNVSRIAPVVSGAEGFVEYRSGLYFRHGYPAVGFNQPVLRVDAGDLDAAVEAVTVNTSRIWGLFVENSVLYIKARWICDCIATETLFRSNGTDAGTVDLRGDQCSTYCGDAGSGGVSIDRFHLVHWHLFNRASLWGALLVAVLPMMVLAGFVLVTKKLPGLFVNLYLGVEAVAIIVYFLITLDSQHGQAHFIDFLKWSFTAYTSLLWVVLAAWSLARVQLPTWEESRQEELKSWAVACVGVSFFVMLHVVTEIYVYDGVGRWTCYAVLTIVQMVLSAIVSRTVPMVTGAIGLFILSWKFAVELVEATGISDSEFATLILLAIMALQGLAIIMGAIFYAGNREKIEGTVKALLRCDMAALREMGARPLGDKGTE